MEDTFGIIFATTIVFTILFLFNKLINYWKRNNIINNPKNIQGNIELGALEYQRNNYDEALQIFNNIDRSVDNELTYLVDYFKAMIYLNKKMFQEAKACFENVINNSSHIKDKSYVICIASSYYHMGFIYFEENNIDDAKKYKDIAKNLDSTCLNYESVSKEYMDL